MSVAVFKVVVWPQDSRVAPMLRLRQCWTRGGIIKKVTRRLKNAKIMAEVYTSSSGLLPVGSAVRAKIVDIGAMTTTCFRRKRASQVLFSSVWSRAFAELLDDGCADIQYLLEEEHRTC
ncbi:hypothetical protein KC351_g29 [Hortaea werneckii]|nr:hypothetical protein KC351_g29 [Hortaea werneckii]